MKNPKKAVFLDRDGTIIIDKIYLNDPKQIEYLDGVTEGMKTLRDNDFSFVIVTNQSGIPRGLVNLDNLNEIHKIIKADLATQGIDILGFYFAPYLVESNHWMRKPNPGMIEAGIKDFGLSIKGSWMVGDRLTDCQAGRTAGLKTVFLTGTEAPPKNHPDCDFVAKTFPQMCQQIIENPDV